MCAVHHGPLVSRREESLPPTSAALDCRPPEIHEHGVVEPHPSGRIGRGPVREFEVGLHPGDETPMAGKLGVVESEVPHAVVDGESGDRKGAVLDLHSLGAVFLEEFGLEMGHWEVVRRVFRSR